MGHCTPNAKSLKKNLVAIFVVLIHYFSMLVFWGDSILAGPPDCGYVPQMIAELVDVQVINMAVGGATSSETVARMVANPDLCRHVAIISMGRCNRTDPVQVILDDWKRAAELLGHDRWFALPQPKTAPRGTEKFAYYSAIDDAVGSLAGDRFLDTDAHLIDDGDTSGMIPQTLLHDPVHLNRAGNLRVARFIADKIVRRGLVGMRTLVA